MTVLLAVLFFNEKFLFNEINGLSTQRGSGLGTTTNEYGRKQIPNQQHKSFLILFVARKLGLVCN